MKAYLTNSVSTHVKGSQRLAWWENTREFPTKIRNKDTHYLYGSLAL